MRATDGPPPVRTMGRIGLWGAPTSGKTTFLAALSIAVARKRTEGLMLYGADGPSTDFLVENTARLTQAQEFPPPTVTGQQLSWVMHMRTRVPARRFGLPVSATVPLVLSLDLLDERGSRFADVGADASAAAGSGNADHLGYGDDADPAAAAGGDGEESFIEQLAGCDGLLLLFDPTREWREGDAFNYFHGTLMKIASRRMQDPAWSGLKLPQYVAVCTTKFDHSDVYQRALDHGFRRFSIEDPYLFPRVPDEDAEDFFVHLVRGSKRGNADLVRDGLREFFYHDRVRFFITSAVGFHLPEKMGMFEEADHSNVISLPEGPRIKGAIHPINVVEPLVWLGQCLAAGR